jgi:hypothetical protein
VRFEHNQCLGEDDLPLLQGVRPRVQQLVEFDLYRTGNSQWRAGSVTAKGGGPLETRGQPTTPPDDEKPAASEEAAAKAIETTAANEAAMEGQEQTLV